MTSSSVIVSEVYCHMTDLILDVSSSNISSSEQLMYDIISWAGGPNDYKTFRDTSVNKTENI